MRFLIQRVTRASVLVQGKLEGEIGPGLLVSRSGYPLATNQPMPTIWRKN